MIFNGNVMCDNDDDDDDDGRIYLYIEYPVGDVFNKL